MSQLLVQSNRGVLRVSLNRPDKRNALSRELLGELLRTVFTAAGDSALRLLVLTGEGPVFCTGMDLTEMHEAASRPDAASVFQSDSQLYRDVVARLIELPVPVLAVLPGPAVAGGLGLVLACDLVIAAGTATFWLPEARRGITAAMITPLLFHRCGLSASSDLLLSGRQVDAATALRYDLIHHVVPADQLGATERDWIANILAGSPGAVRDAKRLLHTAAWPQIARQLDAAVTISALARQTLEAREGLNSFVQKRKPAWDLPR
jgi:methylglutaconyl-CoA hydratase